MIKHSIFVCRWVGLSKKAKNFMVWKVTLTLTEEYGFSPECFVKCIFNCPPCEKALGHFLQGNVFFTWVCSPVFLQTTIFWESLRTLIAKKCFFSWVCFQMSSFWKVLRTLIARKWFFSWVCSQVLLQMSSIWKSFRTLTKRKWFFIWVFS